ncbi:unnamed protein product [Phyllotreta striolata]|uniref:PWWP domain-containing protein n=1 Tax=Phyllotreta striolata TaxID=444603 RepID=A0A9P0DU84_PHYSR|nr:unnamed protein product [Phyllotreta striolata]
MKKANFKVGDKVFAKVKGYPPWPAHIVGENGKKFNVEFYGTGETGSIKKEDLFYFLKYKEKLQKPLKRKDYIDAFEQINEAIENDGGDGDESTNTNVSTPNVSMNISNVSSVESEKGNEKKNVKRKRSLPRDNQIDSSTPTKKSARLSKIHEDAQKIEKEEPEEEKMELPVSPKKSPKTPKVLKQVEEQKDGKEEKKPKEGKADKKDKVVKKVKTGKKDKEDSKNKADDEGKPEADEKAEEGDKVEEKDKVEEVDKPDEIDEAQDVDKPDEEEDEKVDEEKDDKAVQEDKADKEDVLAPEVDEEKKEEPIPKASPIQPAVVETAAKEEKTDVKTNKIKKEKLEEKIKIDLVMERALKNNIAYAEHVRKSQKFYKERPIEPRQDDSNQVLPVKLKSGKIAGIKLHLTWPLKFQNEYDRAIYDESVAKRVLETKEKILKADEEIDENAEGIVPDIQMSEDGVIQMTSLKEVEVKKARIARLNLEAELLGLDVKIKNCLALNKADPKIAIGYLEEIYKLEFDDVVLKKHLHIVEMVRRLRKYVGNIKEWNLSNDSLAEFSKEAKKVREIAEKIYAKFKKTVKLPENCLSFFDGFTELVNKFKAECKELELTETDIFVLSAEPRSRQAFLSRLDEKEAEKVATSNLLSAQNNLVNGTAEAVEDGNAT